MSGGINESILQSVVNSRLQDLPSSDSTAASLLPIEVFKYIRSYLQNHSLSTDLPDYCAFVQMEIPRVEASKFNCSKHISFKINNSLIAQGKVFLTTPDLRTSYSINTLFTDIDEIGNWLSEQGLQSRSTLIVSLKQKVIHWYPEGTDREELCKEYIINDIQNASISAIDTILKHFHHNQVLTPGCSKGIWSNAAKFYPGKNLEGRIQELLKIALASHFHTSVVIDEQKSSIGRFDLLIEHHIPNNQVVRCALLELKAIRSFSFSEDQEPTAYGNQIAEKALKEGVDQANKYRNKWNANLGILCCYDARDGASSEIMKVVEDIAVEKDVNLRHYILYNSAQNQRRSQPDSVFANPD